MKSTWKLITSLSLIAGWYFLHAVNLIYAFSRSSVAALYEGWVARTFELNAANIRLFECLLPAAHLLGLFLLAVLILLIPQQWRMRIWWACLAMLIVMWLTGDAVDRYLGPDGDDGLHGLTFSQGGYGNFWPTTALGLFWLLLVILVLRALGGYWRGFRLARIRGNPLYDGHSLETWTIDLLAVGGLVGTAILAGMIKTSWLQGLVVSFGFSGSVLFWAVFRFAIQGRRLSSEFQEELHREEREDFEAGLAATSGSLGSAGVATSAELRQAGLSGGQPGEGLRIGYGPEGEVLRHTRPGGITLVAPPRSGKATDKLIPALLENGSGPRTVGTSFVVIDPRGQLTAVTGPQRARLGHRVIILNPFGIWRRELGPGSPDHFAGLEDRCIFNARYNPMAGLDPNDPSFTTQCEKQADAIIEGENGEGGAHFRESACELIAGGTMELASSYPPEMANYAELRDIICNSSRLVPFAQAAMATSSRYIRQKLERFADPEAVASDRELRSIISTAKTQTRFIGNSVIGPNLSASDFSFADLKRGPAPTTVYIILPISEIDTCRKWFRVLLAAAIDELLKGGTKGKYGVTLLVDEAAIIGYLPQFLTLANAGAGSGITMYTVLQNLPDAQKIWGKQFETFLSGSAIRLFYAPREMTTSTYVSRASGQRTVRTRSSSLGTSGNHSNTSSGYGETAQPVFLPHEVAGLDRTQFLGFAEGVKNIILGQRKPYWQTELASLASPDPNERPGTPDAPSDAKQDALDVLGLPSSAEFADIKARYHDLAKRYHQDGNGEGDGDAAEFARISAAFATLRRIHEERVV